MTTPTTRFNPYAGPRAFSRQNAEFMFGRAIVCRDLVRLVAIEQTVVVHGFSGSGKTSLIHACVIPRLEEEGFRVLPAARVSGELPQAMRDEGNIFLLNLMLQLDQRGGDPQRLAGVKLTHFLAHLKSDDGRFYFDDSTGPEPFTGEKGQPTSSILIVDQMEEIFWRPDLYSYREDFFQQIRAAIDLDAFLTVVFVIRNDYLGELETFSRLFPSRLRARQAVELLDAKTALMAIKGPAEKAGRTFAPGVAERLVNDLRQIDVPGQETSVVGLYIEPVQLQVVCYQLWKYLDQQTREGEGASKAQITLEDLAEAGDADHALMRFYDGTLAAALAAGETTVDELQLRTWFDTRLITPAGTRTSVFQGEVDTGGLPNQVVRILEAHSLVRTEMRAGQAWVELVNDRLIEPIRQSNAAWFPRQINPLQQQAALWNDQGRPSGLLLRDQALFEAETWATAHPDELTATEKDFLDECRRMALASAARERRQNRRILALGVAAAIIGVLALIAAGFALIRSQEAARARRENRAVTIATASQVAARAQDDDSDIALRLALEAGNMTWMADHFLTESAGKALADAIAAAPARRTIVLKGQNGSLRAATFSPSGEFVLTPSSDGTIGLWRTEDGKLMGTLTGHQGRVNTATFSPEGNLVVTASDDATACIWSATSGVKLACLEGHSAGVTDARWRGDGRRIMTTSQDGTACIWEAPSGSRVTCLPGHEDEVRLGLWNRDGSRIMTASKDGTARVWDAASGDELLRLQHGEIGETIWVNAATWNADETAIITGDSRGGVRIWDATSGAEQHTLRGHSRGITWVEVSPDGRLISTASTDGTARTWDAASGQPLSTLEGHQGWVYAATFSPDGRQIATASRDGTAILWRADTGEKLERITGHRDLVFSATFSPCVSTPDAETERCDATSLLTASSDATARITDLSARQAELRLWHGDPLHSARFSPDGSQIVTAGRGDDLARTWDASNGELLLTLRGHGDSVNGATFSPDGKLIVTTSWDNTARLWDAKTGTPREILNGHGDTVWSGAFHPAGDKVVTASSDRTARVWDVNTGQDIMTLEGHTDWVNWAEFSPDGQRIVTASGDGTARVWDAASGEELVRLVGHDQPVFKARFDRTGQRIVTAGRDGTVRIWDAESGEELEQLWGHLSWVRDAAFGQDGQRVASTGEDGTVRISGLASGGDDRDRALLVLAGHDGQIATVDFSPDGSSVLTAGEDGYARVWPASVEGILSLAEGLPGRELSDKERHQFGLDDPWR